MAQLITPEDVHRGIFRCQTCDTELPVFYHRRCPTCHAEFTLLSVADQENSDGILDLEDEIDRKADLMRHGRL